MSTPASNAADAWDPLIYRAFERERTRPALDLLARVALAAPLRICDLGCGTGNITHLLAERWPAATVCGVDRSPSMLAAARTRPSSSIRWVEADLARWQPDTPVDLVFSNAALHWLDDHPAVLGRWLAALSPEGVLAVQMPRNHAEPSHTAIAAVIDAGPWREQLRPLWRERPVAGADDYARLLLPCVRTLDVWETVYVHVLKGDSPVLAWVAGTVLRPLLAVLAEDERVRFLDACRERLAEAYPAEPGGATLFAFRRLFIVAGR